MYFVFLCFYINEINITNKKKKKINSFEISCANKISLKRRRGLRSLKCNKNWNVMEERKIFSKEAVKILLMVRFTGYCLCLKLSL